MIVKALKIECDGEEIEVLLKIKVKIEEIFNNNISTEEREIISFILQNNPTTQKQLSNIFGAVRVCRVLKQLEQKGIIKRRKKGKTYIIEI